MLVAIFISAQASAQNNTALEVGTGVDYSTGRYGAATDTSVFSIPLELKYQFDHIRLQASIPYVRVQGPGSFVGGIIVPGSTGNSTRSGLGDVNLGATWMINQDTNSFPAIELGAIVKLPTASSGLGTGKVDYTAVANIYHSLNPQFMLFGSVGYQWLGDFGTINLENGVVASAGMNFKPSQTTSIGFAANYHQEYFKGLGDQFTVSPYAMWNFDANWRLVGYGTVGFTTASPKWGAGMRLVFFR
ncbi:MAG TPA: hypothetical protein VGT78_01500 [Rhizomicrobium sp.]|nr:hypothetical protein [Rhizomicrobium sp.]